MVAAELLDGKAFTVVEQAGDREIAPAVAHSNWIGNFSAGDKNRSVVVSDHACGGLKHTVFASEFKTGHGV
jgi:hypothetical protein